MVISTGDHSATPLSEATMFVSENLRHGLKGPLICQCEEELGHTEEAQPWLRSH